MSRKFLIGCVLAYVAALSAFTYFAFQVSAAYSQALVTYSLVTVDDGHIGIEDSGLSFSDCAAISSYLSARFAYLEPSCRAEK